MKLHWIRNKGFYIQVVTSKKNQINTNSLPPEFKKVTKIKNGFNFVTNDFAGTDGLVKSSLADICRMSNAVFNELLAEVREYIGFLYKLNDTLALLDLITTFATVSMSMDYIRPDFGERIFIKGGRHPILERSSAELTPNDCNMSDESRVHILMGANMSGKSTYLRQVVLITVMAQLGCFVPAQVATVKICDRIFSRVSNRDSLELNSSTFMLEMQEIAFILSNATESSMVILDELGRGTSVKEGTAVCWAVCEELLSVGCLTFLATHFSDMNLMSDIHPFVQSYHFLLQTEDGKEVTTHQLVKGGLKVTRTAYGIDTASQSKFALPPEMIERAKELYREMTLSNVGRRISRFDVVSAEHILMLRQLSIQNVKGNDLKTALKNIRDSFVSLTENLPEVVNAESLDGSNVSSKSSSDIETEAGLQLKIIERNKEILSQALSERSRDLSMNIEDSKNPESLQGGGGLLDLSGSEPGGIFGDLPGPEEDERLPPSVQMEGPDLSQETEMDTVGTYQDVVTPLGRDLPDSQDFHRMEHTGTPFPRQGGGSGDLPELKTDSGGEKNEASVLNRDTAVTEVNADPDFGFEF